MVSVMGLEPIRSESTSTSSLLVYLFQHTDMGMGEVCATTSPKRVSGLPILGNDYRET